MPSEGSPGGGVGHERFPEAVESIGEDPARFLDRDLFEHGISRLEDNPSAGYREDDQRLVRDSDVSAPGEMIRDRISGIDRLSVAAVWMKVERDLERTPEGGRDIVIQLLRDRIAELEADGERDPPGYSAEELRELGVDAFENVEKANVVFRGPDGEVTSRTNGSSASQKLAAMADGGDGE